MKNLKSNIIGIAITTVIAVVGAIAILNYKSFIFWHQLEDSFQVDENFDTQIPTASTGSIQIYKDFIMTAPITPENIRAVSHRIQLEGKIASATLHVQASPTQFGRDTVRKHTVYFYVDDGNTGGHLEAKRKDSKIVEGGFKIGDPLYVLNIDATSFVVAKGVDEQVEVRLIDLLNDNQSHWIGAFVATGIYGILNDLTINYVCEQASNCSISAIK